MAAGFEGSTQLKTYGWNLKIASLKRKSHLQNRHGFGFQVSFQGCRYNRLTLDAVFDAQKLDDFHELRNPLLADSTGSAKFCPC